MKKLIALMTAAAMLLASGAALAKAQPQPMVDAVHFGAYAMHDFANDADSKWITFTDYDTTAVETQTFTLTTYAAAYYNGMLYGYVYGYGSDGALQDSFYTVDTNNGFFVDFPGGSSNGEFVYAMAYNYADDTMYALCDEDRPYIASVDLATGVLTRIVDIPLGSYLGFRGMAIDSQGTFYALTMSAVASRLVTIDIETGALTEIGSTGMPAYYAQSMTCDPETDTLYWAELDSSTRNGIYVIDPETAACELVGKVGPEGMELTCLFVFYDEQPAEILPGDVDLDGTVTAADAVLILKNSIGVLELSGDALLAADVDGDGTITGADAVLALRIAMGLS